MSNSTTKCLIADRLRGRRAELLHQWRQLRLAHDCLVPALHDEQFFDHIPAFLESLETELRCPEPGLCPPRRQVERLHGTQRWRLGLGLVDLVSEWFDLRSAILSTVVDDDFDPADIAWFQTWLQARIEEGVCLSLARYEALRQQAAAEQLEQLEQRVAEDGLNAPDAAWREATHDLRGNLGILVQIAQRLRSGDAATDPDVLVEVLSQGLSQALDLLRGLHDAPEDRPPLEAPYPVATLAREWAAPYTALLAPGQAIRIKGPAELQVTTPQAALHRIGQNLWQNAFRHTPQGRIELTYGPRGAHGWYFRICNRWDGDPVEQAGEGRGLGIVKRFVRELGGELLIAHAAHRFQVTVCLPR